MNSVWSDTSRLPSFDTLKRDGRTDVLIIGGGLAGLMCAYFLQQAGVKYLLVEAETICNGITKNTTAKITSQHGLIYQKIKKEFGLEEAALYFKANQAALEEYRKLCQNIQCGFEKKDAYVYTMKDTRKLEEELTVLHQIGLGAELTTDLRLPFQTKGAIKFPNQAQFHPLQFVAAIAGNLHIVEHTKVQELVKEKTGELKAITEHGVIRANTIIVTTHFPFLNKHGSYFFKMYQHRSYVLALQHGPNIKGMYVDEVETGMSFRNYEDLLLIGGGDHRTGKKGGGWKELETFAHQYYPKLQEKYRWATQDCMTLDGIPYIGKYSSKTPNLFVATGFNKWGMTSSMVAALLLSDLVQGIENPYAAVFFPSRSILRKQLVVNGFEAVTNLIKITPKRCPHLGCALKWNEAEHTWDCPCHGSRFTEQGKLIDNPATGDLKQ